MPPAPRNPATPLMLVFGDDDYSVSRRGRQVFDQWCQETGGFDHEIVEATALNSGEALRALARLREALQTLPMFGGAKAVWFRDCNFLAEDRTSASQAVTTAVAALADDLKAFPATGVRLLITAGKVDRRKAFYKTMEKAGSVESFVALSTDSKDWAAAAEDIVRVELQARGKQIEPLALAELVQAVGANRRELVNEADKLATYLGDRSDATKEDVAQVVTRHKHARAFALAEALGDRDLPRLLRSLDEELWEIRAKVNREKSVIGLLYGLIAKVRILLLLKEAVRTGLIKPVRDYTPLKSQLENLPDDAFPVDRRFNLRAVNPYVVFKALPQIANYTTEELIQAMERLLGCNLRLVGSGLDEALVLQQAVVAIVGAVRRPARARP